MDTKKSNEITKYMDLKSMVILFITGLLILGLSALNRDNLLWILFVSSVGLLSILIRVHLSHKPTENT